MVFMLDASSDPSSDHLPRYGFSASKESADRRTQLYMTASFSPGNGGGWPLTNGGGGAGVGTRMTKLVQFASSWHAWEQRMRSSERHQASSCTSIC